jgi:hypothetical protein
MGVWNGDNFGNDVALNFVANAMAERMAVRVRYGSASPSNFRSPS